VERSGEDARHHSFERQPGVSRSAYREMRKYLKPIIETLFFKAYSFQIQDYDDVNLMAQICARVTAARGESGSIFCIPMMRCAESILWNNLLREVDN
jgi:ACT domain-containing protein